MGSRARRFGPGASRARNDNRGRRYEEPPQFRGREGQSDPSPHKQSPNRNIRGKLEGAPDFRNREQSPDFRSQESARERIRRENEEHARSRERSRSNSHRYSPGHRSSKERPPSKGRAGRSRERKRHSPERRGRSGEKRSGGLRFEPPDNRPHKRARSSSKDRRTRYSPPRDEDLLGIPNRFSPPAPERFHEAPFNKEEFDPTCNFNQDMFMEMSDGPPGTSGQIMNNQGFLPNQGFIPQQNLILNPQPMGNQEYPQDLMIKSQFPHNSGLSMSDQGFPPAQGQFVDNSLQAFPGQGVGTEDPLIPEFNPETSKLSSHEWVKLIDETARQYDWKKDEKQYIMASRLSGFARQWYLTSGITCKGWGELRQAFLSTFPTEMGFHTLLTKMLARVKEDNESMASYFHHKVALLNACDILGRKAVSCIIAGLPNMKLRLQAKTQNFEDPDELYLFLRSYDPEPPVKKTQQKSFPADDSKNKTTKVSPNNRQCYFCGSLGHIKIQCPQLKHKLEHQLEENEKESNMSHNNKVMHGSLSRKATYPKYFTDAIINGVSLKGYVDQGSECTTIREENAQLLHLPIKKQYKVIRGFAGSALSSIGVVDIPLCIDRAIANIFLFVVPDHLQAIPVVIGQSFTEQPHVVVMKDGDKIRFYQRMDNGKTNFDF